MGDDGKRWTVRGVPTEVARAVAQRAAEARMTIGEFLTAALQTALKADTRAAEAGGVIERLVDLERRLSRLEASAALPPAIDVPPADVVEVPPTADVVEALAVIEPVVPAPADVADPVQFGQRVRLERERRGLSQAALAAAAGVHHGAVSKVERGRQGGAGDCAKLAAALDLVTG